VLCHYFSNCRQLGFTEFDFRLGSYGPHLFFIISGYVIFMTLERTPGLTEFAYSRCTRLFPLYWICVLISMVTINQFHLAPNGIGVTQLLGNLTMLQTWLKIEDIEVSYWTLAVELKFYALAAAFICLRNFMTDVPGRDSADREVSAENIRNWLRDHVTTERLCACWLMLVVLFRAIDYVRPLPAVIALPLILDYAHYFVAGIMYYQLKKCGFSILRNGLILAALPLAYAAEGTETALVTAACLGVFYAYVAGRMQWICYKPLVFMGSISYAQYLIHGSLGEAAMNSFVGLGMWPAMALALAISTLLAWFLTAHFERPMLVLLRSFKPSTHRTSTAYTARAVVS
jgi:peptidoglycan/LPS O-acetylase OafA/YrhL